jgi:hypothetical protein
MILCRTKIHSKLVHKIFVADYLISVLRGTRTLSRFESRSIVASLRKHCVRWFEPQGVQDTMALSVMDSYRYRPVWCVAINV